MRFFSRSNRAAAGIVFLVFFMSAQTLAAADYRSEGAQRQGRIAHLTGQLAVGLGVLGIFAVVSSSFFSSDPYLAGAARAEGAPPVPPLSGASLQALLIADAQRVYLLENMSLWPSEEEFAQQFPYEGDDPRRFCAEERLTKLLSAVTGESCQRKVIDYVLSLACPQGEALISEQCCNHHQRRKYSHEILRTSHRNWLKLRRIDRQRSFGLEEKQSGEEILHCYAYADGRSEIKTLSSRRFSLELKRYYEIYRHGCVIGVELLHNGTRRITNYRRE